MTFLINLSDLAHGDNIDQFIQFKMLKREGASRTAKRLDLIGNDGHVAVERSADDVSCSDTEIPAHPVVTSEHTGSCCALTPDHCGECRDIALTSDYQDEQARAPQKPSEIKSVQPLAISGPLSDPGGIEACHQYPVKSTHTSYHLSLASIRSTVLLI